MGGERLRSVGSDPLRSPVQLGAHRSASGDDLIPGSASAGWPAGGGGRGVNP